jgi:hypothetical protein
VQGLVRLVPVQVSSKQKYRPQKDAADKCEQGFKRSPVHRRNLHLPQHDSADDHGEKIKCYARELQVEGRPSGLQKTLERLLVAHAEK